MKEADTLGRVCGEFAILPALVNPARCAPPSSRYTAGHEVPLRMKGTPLRSGPFGLFRLTGGSRAGNFCAETKKIRIMVGGRGIAIVCSYIPGEVR